MKIKEKHFLLPIPVHVLSHLMFINIFIYSVWLHAGIKYLCCMGELIKIIAAVWWWQREETLKIKHKYYHYCALY